MARKIIQLNTSFSFKIYTSTSEFPSNWNDFSANNIFFSKEYLHILEVSSPNNISSNFIGLFQNEKLVGVALTQFNNLSLVNSYGERDNCIKNKIQIINMFDEKFFRMWEFYLASCESAFKWGDQVVYQFQLTKNYMSTPNTRDYIYK